MRWVAHICVQTINSTGYPKTYHDLGEGFFHIFVRDTRGLESQHVGDWAYSNYLEWIGERNRKLFDHDFIENQFENAGEYKKFLFEYLKSHQLPDDVKMFIDEMEK